jgi:hypothetical protein
MNCRTLIEEAMRLSTLSFFARLSGQFPSIHYALFGQEHEHPSNKPALASKLSPCQNH